MAAMPASASSTRDPDVDRLRDAIVAAGRRLGARGLISAGEGNLSVRLPGGRLLVTPSGRRKDELEPGDLLVVSIAATSAEAAAWTGRADPRPTSDLTIHRAILAARPDVGAIIHAHLPAAMALTLAGVAPDPAALPETALFLPRLPLVPFAAPGSADLARQIATALSEPPAPLPGAAILERHGAVAVGELEAAHEPGDDDGSPESDSTQRHLDAIRQALDRLELVEVLCRTWRDALQIAPGAISFPGPARSSTARVDPREER